MDFLKSWRPLLVQLPYQERPRIRSDRTAPKVRRKCRLAKNENTPCLHSIICKASESVCLSVTRTTTWSLSCHLKNNSAYNTGLDRHHCIQRTADANPARVTGEFGAETRGKRSNSSNRKGSLHQETPLNSQSLICPNANLFRAGCCTTREDVGNQEYRV